MSDMNARRMAYRNAARSATYQFESEQLKSEADTSKNLKVFHAHGYVIYRENQPTGEERWTRDSAFSNVFTDFETAKKYLLEKFGEVLDCVYRVEKADSYYPEGQCDTKEESPVCRKEYIEEHIEYVLVISEISPFDENKKSGLTVQDSKDWHLRYTGEIINN